MRIRDLGLLTATLSLLVVIDGLSMPLFALCGWLAPQIFHFDMRAVLLLLLLGIVGFRLLTIVVFSRWIFIAGDNLVRVGFDDLRFTPARRIISFLVPIAFFFMPFQGMRELWNASHGERAYAKDNRLVSTWWTLWVVGGILTTLMSFGSLYLLMPLWIAQAIIAILLIRAIARAQRNLSGAGLEQVFA